MKNSIITLLAGICLAVGTAISDPPPTGSHEAPLWGYPSDSAGTLCICYDSHLTWSHDATDGICWKHLYTQQTYPWQTVYCDWPTVWNSAAMDHYWLSPLPNADCYGAVKTYAGYGGFHVECIQCPDHASADPALYYTEHVRAARWGSTEKRGEHTYVRPPTYTGTCESVGTGYSYVNRSSFYITVKCGRYNENEHDIYWLGPNNWTTTGSSCSMVPE